MKWTHLSKRRSKYWCLGAFLQHGWFILWHFGEFPLKCRGLRSWFCHTYGIGGGSVLDPTPTREITISMGAAQKKKKKKNNNNLRIKTIQNWPKKTLEKSNLRNIKVTKGQRTSKVFWLYWEWVREEKKMTTKNLKISKRNKYKNQETLPENRQKNLKTGELLRKLEN